MIEYENLARLNEPYFEDYKKTFAHTLDSGWFILGKNVEQFEADFARYIGTRHCIGVASGLDALLLALKAYDFPKETEVIVPSNTYIATILAILQAGLKPVLVEPSKETYNIDPKKIERAITKNTRALMIVHLYGKACEMDKISSICHSNNLKLIEDCAQSHGARHRGKVTGSFGIGAFSFYPTKNLGALGDAGAITCDDDKFAETIRTLRNYGSKVKYKNELLGYNSRLDEMQAGFLSIKLKQLDRINSHKRALASVYLKNLTKKVILPTIQEDAFDVYHIFNIRTDRRDELREYMLKNGVKTDIHYPTPPHQQLALKTLFKGKAFPISEEIHQTTLSLPISTIHKEDEIKRVCEVVNGFFA